jgi:hypothetical protein
MGKSSTAARGGTGWCRGTHCKEIQL